MSQKTLELPWNKLRKLRSVIDKLNNHHNENILISRDWEIESFIKSFVGKLETLERRSKITEGKVNRKEIKIYFFGKISVGKSRVINAMLGKDIFVSVKSHSTSCFVHVAKSINEEYIIKYKKIERDEVLHFENLEGAKNKIKELSTCHDKNNTNTLKVNESIYCFVVCDEKSKILKENIEIVDSPGSGNKEEISNFIKEHSLDADIFIFVLRSSITEEDKLFFKYQSKNSNKLDIFILINACDDTDKDNEGDNNCSTENILIECKDFLQNCNSKFVDERIFCISAAEMFDIRTGKVSLDNKDPNYSKKIERLKAFENFEELLLNYIEHLLDNRVKRYEDDVKNINEKIDKAFKEFSGHILSIKKDSILKKYEEEKSQLNGLRNQIKNNCTEKKKTFNNFLKEMEDLVNSYDLYKVNIAIMNKHGSLDIEIGTFAESQVQILSTFLNSYKLDINIDCVLQFQLNKSWNPKMTLKTELKLKSHKETTTYAKSKMIYIPFYGAYLACQALNIVEEIEKENETLQLKYLSELKTELQNQNKEKLKI